MAHNIIAGRVTNRANSQHRTPNWLKAVYAVIAGLVAIVALSLTLAPSQSSDSLPPCELEDGSTQSVCIWESEHGLDVVNVDYGRYYYREVPQ